MVRLPPAARPLYPYLKPAYSRGTGWIAPISQCLSRVAGRQLPTGVVASTEQAAASTGGRCFPAVPAQVITRTAPPPGPADDVFAAELSEQQPRTVAAELPDGRVLGPHRAVVTARGDLVQDLSYYFGTSRPREHPLFLHPFPGPPTRIAGRLGVLATRGDVNYYHFLMDVLPRLAVLDAAPQLERPERWYVPATSRFQRELLRKVGITGDQVVDSDAVPHVRADVLVVPSPPSMTVINPPWVVGHLRERLLPSGLSRVDGRGLYVTRGGTAHNRQVIDEDRVVAELSALGFRCVDAGALSVDEQITLFAQASVIVSAHGAALANLVFASPGATVIELFPAGHVVPDYWKLANGVPGLRYRYLVGRGGATRSRAQLLVTDIDVDRPRLLSAAQDALGECA